MMVVDGSNATSDFERHPSLKIRARLVTGPGSGTSIANQRKFQHFSERKKDILDNYRPPKNLLWFQTTIHLPWVAIDLFKVTNTYRKKRVNIPLMATVSPGLLIRHTILNYVTAA